MRKRFCPPGTIPYVIRPGDTFAVIARQFKISIADLRMYNYAMDHNFLIPGETLCIPVNIYRPPYYPIHPHKPRGYQKPPEKQAPQTQVKPEFTSAPAAPVFSPMGLENKELPFTRSEGNAKACEACEGGTPYVIVKGDTLIRIAKKHNVFLQDLLDSNPALNPQYYIAGQTICIPKGNMSGGNTYTVVRGDNLRGIADKTRFSTRALRAYNPEINWTHLKIGQKIFVPRV